MLTLNKKIIIYRKTDASEFSKRNYKVLPDGAHKIGASINAVRDLTVQSDMLNELMPSILGVSKSQVDFTKNVTAYWNSLSVSVPDAGKQLEVGFIYDISETTKQEAISSIKGADDKPKKLTSDKELADYVESFIDDGEKWRYAKPISAADYLLWRYSLNYKAVANTPDEQTIGKSDDIRFYIHDEITIKKAEQNKFDMRKLAGKIYFDIISKPEDIKSYLFAMGKGVAAITLDELDQAKLLETVYLNEPNLLVSTSKDKQLKKRAYIEECITQGILRRLENTTVIVNSADNAPIGNNMEDAIAFLDSESNVKVANEIQGKLRSLPKI